MKIQHGALTDEERKQAASKAAAQQTAPPTPIVVEKDRLFETIEKEKTSERSYAKLLLIAVVVVLIAGGVIFYLTLPGPGDLVRAPKGMEDAVRAHLLEQQKRTATDIVFYYCGTDSYWARSGVETRKDIPNPVYKLDKYAVTIKGTAPSWTITSTPVSSPDQDKPCS